MYNICNVLYFYQLPFSLIFLLGFSLGSVRKTDISTFDLGFIDPLMIEIERIVSKIDQLKVSVIMLSVDLWSSVLRLIA